MFVNEPQNYRTVDHDRGAVLRMIMAGSSEYERPHLFVLEWGGRRIPFQAYAHYRQVEAVGIRALRWEVFGLGKGFETRRESPADYIFGSAEERTEAEALILEALRVHGIVAIDNVPRSLRPCSPAP
jgi:hypothetical protein